MKLSELNPSSRVWIYQSDRLLTDTEVKGIEEQGMVFVENWSAHGSALEAAVEVKLNCFIVVSVDENVANATGCSIDKSVHFVKDLGHAIGVDFFNRLNVAVENGDNLQLLNLNTLKSLVEDGVLTPESTMFNNTVTTLWELNEKWRISLADSWAANYM